MDTTEIVLTFNRADFEEIYFRNNNEKIFLSPGSESIRIYLFSVQFKIKLFYPLI